MRLGLFEVNVCFVERAFVEKQPRHSVVNPKQFLLPAWLSLSLPWSGKLHQDGAEKRRPEILDLSPGGDRPPEMRFQLQRIAVRPGATT